MTFREHKDGLLSLSPIVVLLAVYLGASLFIGDFYAVPISVVFVVAVVYALMLLRGHTFNERIAVFSQGAANPDIMYMLWIFCLAGIFASVAKAMGAVDATVNLTLSIVPSRYIFGGLFIASCFVSMAIGTAVGTIVALIPVTIAIAEQIGCDVASLSATVVGGAFFGDNLSFISDTTIAATQTQGCRMREKFLTNARIVFPAAILVLLIYIYGSQTVADTIHSISVEWYRALPYLLVILLALCGVNVLVVLLCGIVFAVVMGLAGGMFNFAAMFAAAGEGLQQMTDLILVTLLAGGLMNIVKESGGFIYLTQLLTSRIKSSRGAEIVIVLLTALTNLCTANNTIAILTCGSITRDLSSRYGILPRRAASLMDTASCCTQGVIPYGAQLLMAAGLASISPLEIIPHLYYPMAVGTLLMLSVIFSPRNRVV
ncbi:MAG: Na+/H+ antiporter NhaC family protein [Alistipes sp.]|nr:Na+/H+ antiporter NhaC family protein [Alistipes sp.]